MRPEQETKHEGVSASSSPVFKSSSYHPCEQSLMEIHLAKETCGIQSSNSSSENSREAKRQHFNNHHTLLLPAINLLLLHIVTFHYSSKTALIKLALKRMQLFPYTNKDALILPTKRRQSSNCYCLYLWKIVTSLSEVLKSKQGHFHWVMLKHPHKTSSKGSSEL